MSAWRFDADNSSDKIACNILNRFGGAYASPRRVGMITINRVCLARAKNLAKVEAT